MGLISKGFRDNGGRDRKCGGVGSMLERMELGFQSILERSKKRFFTYARGAIVL